MNRPGAGPQPLRGLHTFAAQQVPQSRNAPLGSGRLPNGKGTNSTWGFAVPIGGAPGLPSPQARSNNPAMASFAQTIGGSQPSTPLDLSEFPSLSSAQPQQFSPVTWGNPSQRASTHISSQLFQGAGTGTAPAASSHAPASIQTQGTHPTHPHQQDTLFSASHFSGGLDDTRFGGGHNVIGQPKTTSIEEFPPLGRTATGEIGQDRRESLIHGGDPTEHPNGSVLGPNSNQSHAVHGRAGLLGNAGGLMEGARQGGNTIGMMGPFGFDTGSMSATRSLGDSIRQRQAIPGDQERNGAITSTQNGTQFAALGSLSQSTIRPESVDQQSSRPMTAGGQSMNKQLEPSQSGLEGDVPGSPQNTRAPEALASLTELDRYGLTGLLHMIRSEGSDIGSLAIGQDLTALGLDLNQPDNRPLYQSFASPFAELGARPIEPDYYIPPCYNVHNVRPIHEQITSFSDETLFYMFYAMPRDILQELAAVELTNRMWRYHKDLKIWLTKDNTFEPVRVSATEERGLYIFFDTNSWQRQRRELVLRYDDLEGRIVPITGSQAS